MLDDCLIKLNKSLDELSNMRCLLRGTVARDFNKIYDELMYEIRSYGRGSLFLWHRLLSYVDVAVEGEQCRYYVVKRITNLLKYSMSIEEKAYVYISMLDFLPPVLDIVREYVDRSTHAVLGLEDPLVKVDYLSRLIGWLYARGFYGMGDGIFNIAVSIIRGLPRDLAIDAYLSIGRALVSKDMADADSVFLMCYDLAKKLTSIGKRAVAITKVASIYGSVLRDKYAMDLSDRWLSEGIGLCREYAVDRTKFLAETLPYIFHYDENMGMKYLDMLLSDMWRRGVNAVLMEKLLASLPRIHGDAEIIDRIDRWIERMYKKGKIGDTMFARLESAVVYSFLLLDPYKAYSLLQHVPEIVAQLGAHSVEDSIAILKNISLVAIPFTYTITISLVEELLGIGNLLDATRVLGETQHYFPRKIDEVYRYILHPFIKRASTKKLLSSLEYIARLRTSSIDQLFRNIVRKAEDLKEPRSIRVLLSVTKALLYRNRPWAIQLAYYIEEKSTTLPQHIRAETLAALGSIMFSIDREYGRRLFLETLRIAEDAEPEEASRIVSKILRYMHELQHDPQINQLVLYAVELSQTSIKG